ncbi:hypothetical protein [Rickettsiales endosymbiont of Peranema trichophorum]|uniref:hypothetical protein n=1 Tax=Rickettsiales endosymbiont of Peranema trichophorum TaxID=2486577 RepID=UPI0013EE6FE3|nr:hypothetical protein [Rickettsiales endosymbiont of Peranema trichophorum]
MDARFHGHDKGGSGHDKGSGRMVEKRSGMVEEEYGSNKGGAWMTKEGAEW